MIEQDNKWNSSDLSDEASLKDGDQIEREIRRNDESIGDADDRDTAGAVDSNETPHGREEAKNDIKGDANVNG